MAQTAEEEGSLIRLPLDITWRITKWNDGVSGWFSWTVSVTWLLFSTQTLTAAGSPVALIWYHITTHS